jgi:hypothetical protein
VNVQLISYWDLKQLSYVLSPHWPHHLFIWGWIFREKLTGVSLNVTLRPHSNLAIRIVTRRQFSRRHPKYAHATIEDVLQELFSMCFASCPLLGNGWLNTFPKKQTRGRIRTFIVRQRCGKQALWTIQTVFSVRSVQSGYKRVEYRSWQLWKNGNERIEREQKSTTELDCEKTIWCVLQGQRNCYNSIARIRLAKTEKT